MSETARPIPSAQPAPATTVSTIVPQVGQAERTQRVSEKLKQELGPTLLDALADPNVTDIWRNQDGTVWVNDLIQGAVRLNMKMSDFVASNLIGTVSGALGVEVSGNSPFLEGELPLDGSRFSASLPPAVPHPIIAIRKHSVLSRTLDDYVKMGSMTPSQCTIIRTRIKAKDNILIAGAQASGKSTLGGAVLKEMVASSDHTRERFAILEDTVELQIPPGINFYSMRTNEALGITMDNLVKKSLRYTATRFIVGEVRGQEAQSLLEAWSTGHPGGLATIHAGNARGALRRFEQLIRKSGAPIDRAEIATVVNLIIVIAKMPTGGRVVREVMRVVEGNGSDYVLTPV